MSAFPASKENDDTRTDDKVKITDTLNKIIPLTELRDSARSELLAMIESLRGLKCLVVQSDLGGMLNQVLTESKPLKDIGVQYFRELRNSELAPFTGDDASDMGAVSGVRGVPDNIVYLVRPELHVMHMVARQINAVFKQYPRMQFLIYFVPYRTVACEQTLEDEGVLRKPDRRGDVRAYPKVEVGEFSLGLVAFDGDLLSMEMDGVFRQCYVDGDTSSLPVVAAALHGLQELYGAIRNVKGKGAAARKVLQSMLHMRCSASQNSNHDEMDEVLGTSKSSLGYTTQRRDIDTLVVLDREADLVSPLLSPLTYEGLIDDILGVETGKVKLAAELLGDEPNVNVQELTGGKVSSAEADAAGVGAEPAKPKRLPGELVSVPLNDSDTIFAEIRDLSIEHLGAYLQNKAIAIKQRYANFRDNKDATIIEIHDFVKRLPALTKEYKALYQHINIAELLKKITDAPAFREQWQGERGMLEGEGYVDAIEEMIYADAERLHLYKILRLMCLQSICLGGIRSNRYDNIRRLLIQTYGYEILFKVSALEKVGLLKRKDLMLVDTAPVWRSISNQLKLLADENDPNSARSGISYVTAGYAPLSARLVEKIGAPGGWRGVSDVLRLLPGPMLEFTQGSTPEELSEALRRSDSAPLSGVEDLNVDSSVDGDDGKKVLLLFVVGGLSFLEVAALRHLSKNPAFPYKIIMASTKITSGNGLLRSVGSVAPQT